MDKKAKKIFTTRKFGGDDVYSWAVFKKGQREPVCTGQSMYSARFLAKQLQQEHDAKQAVNVAGDLK